jgi:sec-independent protein translocase protein TatB
MSFQDSALIFFIALLLFGPKKLPELARQLGKLMGEFRRASNEFRMQMEEELRLAEQADQQKKIAAMEAAAPVTPAITEGTENTIAAPVAEAATAEAAEETPDSMPWPIASSGELKMMPPDTGLPVASSASVSHAFDSVPHVPDPETVKAAPTDQYAEQQLPDRKRGTTESPAEQTATEAPLHG